MQIDPFELVEGDHIELAVDFSADVFAISCLSATAPLTADDAKKWEALRTGAISAHN